MAHARDDVVDAALRILDEYGLPSLSMRRLATSLGVQQSALYWHFESKQVLLAAVAEEILRRGPQPRADEDWGAAVVARAEALHDALLAYRDGAELVSTVYSFRLGAEEPHRRLADDVAAAGASADDAQVAATVLWQFVLGFTFSEQQHLQAGSAGALPAADPRDASTREALGRDRFRAGLALVLDGLRARSPERLSG